MNTVTPIAKDQGIKKNIFEQALDKAKTVISGERTDATAKAKVEPATKQIKSNIKAEKPDAYIKPEQANQAPADKPADTSTVKELWNKAVKVIKEDVVKPIETTVKKITGLETDGKLKTEDIKLKLGNTSTVKNADGTDTTINEVASAEQIEAVRAEVSRNANTILSHATANNKAVEQKQRTYAELQSELQTEADKSKTTGKPSYESNIDLSSDDTKVKQRNEEIKQAWANLEANRKMMQEYRDSLAKDKDELADITAQETEVDKELAEIQKLQENLRQSVGSTVTLTNGAKLTNDGVEDNGKGIRQLNSEELKAKGIKDPEKLLGKDNAFIEYESKDKDGKALTKQHLVNSKLENNKRVTNITTDAQDLNNDGTIQAEELPSENNKPLEKIIGNFDNNQDLKNLYLSSVQFNGDKTVIPPSAQNRIGDKYSDVYGSIPDGQFKTLQLSKGETGMTVESLKGDEFWKQYTTENNLNNIIAKTYTVRQTEVIAPKPDTSNSTNTISNIYLPLNGNCLLGIKTNNPDFSGSSSTPKDFYRFTLNQQELEKLITKSAKDTTGAGRDAQWLNEAYSNKTLTSESVEQEKSFGNYDVIKKIRDPQGNFTYELNLSEEAYRRFQERLSKN